MEFQREKLGQAEYEEVLLDTLSKIIVPRSYIEQNKEFWDNVVFEMFKTYYLSHEEVSIRRQAEYLEIFFSSLFKCTPSTEKTDDIITL